jgi:hypothetical protein
VTKFTIDFRFAEIHYELWALGHFLQLTETQIASLGQQEEKRTLAELRDNGWDHDDAEVDIAYQQLHDIQQIVVPRYLRGPIVISLWSCYEAGLKEVASYQQNLAKARLRLGEIRGNDFIDSAERYFDVVLRFPVDVDKPRLKRLNDLQKIRHFLVHQNGQLRLTPPDKKKQMNAVLERCGLQADDTHDVVVITASFLKQAFDDVNGSLHDLISRLRSAPAAVEH